MDAPGRGAGAHGSGVSCSPGSSHAALPGRSQTDHRQEMWPPELLPQRLDLELLQAPTKPSGELLGDRHQLPIAVAPVRRQLLERQHRLPMLHRLEARRVVFPRLGIHSLGPVDPELVSELCIALDQVVERRIRDLRRPGPIRGLVIPNLLGELLQEHAEFLAGASYPDSEDFKEIVAKLVDENRDTATVRERLTNPLTQQGWLAAQTP